MAENPALDRLCIDTIRTLSIDAVEKANSGHPGLPLGAAPMAYVLWQRHLRHDPRDPAWPDRDRFVLSAGHGSMLLYALLHLYGYDLPLEEIRRFRQWGSRTPGHPEFGLTPGVEATTGPLGQGSANAVGMAIAERFLANRYNRPGHTIVDHFTYALVSDGDLMEGISAEAASLAGHLGLGKLVYLYDSNDVSLDGPCSMTFTEDVARRYESYGWHVETVAQGNTDLAALDRALAAARAETRRPSIVIVKTTLGYGSPKKAGTAAAHGSPLGADEVQATKTALGWKAEGDFQVPTEARVHFRGSVDAHQAAHRAWNERFQGWARAFPDLAREFEQARAGELPAGWEAAAPRFEPGTKLATRASAGKVLNALAAKIPWLLGGDADLGGSTNTVLQGGGDFDGATGAGRNLHYGVREHAMGAIANGIAYHGGARSFTATFFVFSDYMRPAIRLAAMNHLPVTFVFTHDSIGLGEDGPTHQPVEHLAALRAMPNLLVLRPADTVETAECWQVALANRNGPSVIALTRQALPTLRTQHIDANLSARGGYVLMPADGDRKVTLIATGSEVSIAVDARTKLQAEGIGTAIVSLPCWELFDRQPPAYRDDVLAGGVRIGIEAAGSFGWERYLGADGCFIGMTGFGASAPAGDLYKHFGITADAVVAAARKRL
jgi:transketolase